MWEHGIGDPETRDFHFNSADLLEFDAQRTAIVAGWRGYLARKRATTRAPGKSLPGAAPPQGRRGTERNG